MLTRSNLVIPEILTEAIQGQYAGQICLWGTGAAIVSPTMPNSGPAGGKIKGGDTIKIPYFGTIGELDDVGGETDALTPATLSMTSETNTVKHSGKAVEISDWAQLAAQYADPYKEFARQLMIAVMRRADQALIDAATASLPSSQINDVSGGTNNLTYDVLVDSRMKWADEQQDIALLSVHSTVFKNMLKLKDTTGRPLLILPQDDIGALARFNGIPVSVSDRNTIDGNGKFHSKVVKKGALAFWYSKEPTVDTDKDILTDSEVMALHLYWVAHRYARTPGATRPGVVDIVTDG
jgi:HK97 family phage major capsid protein